MTTAADHRTQRLLRDLSPQVLGAVLRRFRDFAAAEDAVQEALLAASTQWPRDGLPDNPRGWLIQVASRRIADHVRADAARRHREAYVVSLVPAEEQLALAADEEDPAARDDTLDLLFMCCHPVLSPSSAIALIGEVAMVGHDARRRPARAAETQRGGAPVAAASKTTPAIGSADVLRSVATIRAA